MSTQRSGKKRADSSRFTLERIQVVAIAATVFAVPLFMWPGLTDYNYAKCILSLILISGLLVLWGLTAWRRTVWTIRVPWLLVPTLGLVIAGGLSLIHATNGRVVVQSLVLLVFFVLLLWMIANVVRDPRDVRLLLIALLVSGSLAALYGVLQYFGVVPGSPGQTGVKAILSSMGNRNHLGGFLLYLFYPSVILLLRAKARWLKSITLVALTFTFCTMLLVEQEAVRIAFALVTAALAVGWIIFRPVRPTRSNRWWLLALAGAVISIFTCSLILTPLTDAGDGVWAANSGRGREINWWIGAEMLADHPITGTGLGNYKLNFIPSKADFLATKRGQALDFPRPRAAQAHNEYLQAGAELGSVGLLMLFGSLGILAVSLWIRLKRSQEDSRLDLLLLTTGVLAFLVHSLVSFPAHVVGSSIGLVVLCGLALSCAYGKAANFAWELTKWKGKALHTVLVILAVGVSAVAVADARANWLMERGITEVQAGLYSTGEETLQHSLQLDFAPRQTYYYLAIAQLQLGKIEQAEINLEKCMTRFVDEASLLNYANLLVNTGQSERAFEPLDLLLASHPRPEIEPRAQYLRALAISETGDPERAITLIEQLLVSQPTYETAYIGLGSVYESLGRFDEARTRYERGLEVVDEMLSERRAAIDAMNGAIAVATISQLQAQIEKLTNERDTLLERLRELPDSTTP